MSQRNLLAIDALATRLPLTTAEPLEEIRRVDPLPIVVPTVTTPDSREL